MNIKDLNYITENEFEYLKNIGMLWEIYPDAPENYEDIEDA